MNVLAYRLKYSFPRLFSLAESLAYRWAGLRFSRRTGRAAACSSLEGTVAGQPARVRMLTVEDASLLSGFLAALPEAHLRYFKPHRFDPEGVRLVLRSKAILTYGFFVDDQLAGYALIKITPTGGAFAGSLVAPEWSGRGIGKFLSSYMYWQAYLAGLRCHATIAKDNVASLKAYKAGRDYRVVRELPNEYLLLEFPPMPQDQQPPMLSL